MAPTIKMVLTAPVKVSASIDSVTGKPLVVKIKMSIIVRKAYGAGLYAFSGPGFRPDVTLALPTAEIAVMGPEAAVNAVYYNKIQELPEEKRAAFVAERQAEYDEDIDLMRVASELIIDGVVEPEDLRLEIIERLAYASRKSRHFSERRHGVPPV